MTLFIATVIIFITIFTILSLIIGFSLYDTRESNSAGEYIVEPLTILEHGAISAMLNSFKETDPSYNILSRIMLKENRRFGNETAHEIEFGDITLLKEKSVLSIDNSSDPVFNAISKNKNTALGKILAMENYVSNDIPSETGDILTSINNALQIDPEFQIKMLSDIHSLIKTAAYQIIDLEKKTDINKLGGVLYDTISTMTNYTREINDYVHILVNNASTRLHSQLDNEIMYINESGGLYNNDPISKSFTILVKYSSDIDNKMISIGKKYKAIQQLTDLKIMNISQDIQRLFLDDKPRYIQVLDIITESSNEVDICGNFGGSVLSQVQQKYIMDNLLSQLDVTSDNISKYLKDMPNNVSTLTSSISGNEINTELNSYISLLIPILVDAVTTSRAARMAYTNSNIITETKPVSSDNIVKSKLVYNNLPKVFKKHNRWRR